MPWHAVSTEERSDSKEWLFFSAVAGSTPFVPNLHACLSAVVANYSFCCSTQTHSKIAFRPLISKNNEIYPHKLCISMGVILEIPEASMMDLRWKTMIDCRFATLYFSAPL